MSKEWKVKLWAAAKRALHTFAQTMIGVIGSAALLEEVNWWVVLSASVLAAVISVLKSIVVGMPEVEEPHEPDEDE